MTLQPQESHKDNPDLKLQEARDKVLSAFESKRLQLGNSNSNSVNKGFEMQMNEPINVVGRKWKAKREELLKDGVQGAEKEVQLLALQKENQERLEAVVKLVTSYIENIAAQHGGWLDAEAMAEISSSINKSAAIYNHLLINGNPKMFKVMEVVMGGTVDGKSHSESIAKTLPVLAEMATFEMSRGDKGVMPCIWLLANFLTRPERIEFGKLYAKGKTSREVDEFLRYGNGRGVLSVDEMQVIMAGYSKNPDFKFSDAKELTATWAQANDLQTKIKGLTYGTYGSQNDAGKRINFKNILITAGQLAAGATIGGNLLFGAWKGGALKSPRDLMLTVTNPVVLLAGGAYKALSLAKSDERIDRTMEGSETRAENRRKEALRILEREKKGNVLWDQWVSFFATNGKGGQDFGGAKVFYDFILDARARAKSSDLPEGEMSTSKFMAYLEEQSKSQKPRRKEVDYKGLLDTFKQFSPPGVLSFAKAFDTLNIGGNDAKDKFENTMKQVDQA